MRRARELAPALAATQPRGAAAGFQPLLGRAVQHTITIPDGVARLTRSQHQRTQAHASILDDSGDERDRASDSGGDSSESDSDNEAGHGARHAHAVYPSRRAKPQAVPHSARRKQLRPRRLSKLENEGAAGQTGAVGALVKSTGGGEDRGCKRLKAEPGRQRGQAGGPRRPTAGTPDGSSGEESSGDDASSSDGDGDESEGAPESAEASSGGADEAGSSGNGDEEGGSEGGSGSDADGDGEEGGGGGRLMGVKRVMGGPEAGRYSARLRATVPARGEVRTTARLVTVGYYDCPRAAARERDLAHLALHRGGGTGLNLPLEGYCLEEVLDMARRLAARKLFPVTEAALIKRARGLATGRGVLPRAQAQAQAHGAGARGSRRQDGPEAEARAGGSGGGSGGGSSASGGDAVRLVGLRRLQRLVASAHLNGLEAVRSEGGVEWDLGEAEALAAGLVQPPAAGEEAAGGQARAAATAAAAGSAEVEREAGGGKAGRGTRARSQRAGAGKAAAQAPAVAPLPPALLSTLLPHLPDFVPPLPAGHWRITQWRERLRSAQEPAAPQPPAADAPHPHPGRHTGQAAGAKASRRAQKRRREAGLQEAVSDGDGDSRLPLAALAAAGRSDAAPADDQSPAPKRPCGGAVNGTHPAKGPAAAGLGRSHSDSHEGPGGSTGKALVRARLEPCERLRLALRVEGSPGRRPPSASGGRAAGAGGTEAMELAGGAVTCSSDAGEGRVHLSIGREPGVWLRLGYGRERRQSEAVGPAPVTRTEAAAGAAGRKRARPADSGGSDTDSDSGRRRGPGEGLRMELDDGLELSPGASPDYGPGPRAAACGPPAASGAEPGRRAGTGAHARPEAAAGGAGAGGGARVRLAAAAGRRWVGVAGSACGRQCVAVVPVGGMLWHAEGFDTAAEAARFYDQVVLGLMGSHGPLHTNHPPSAHSTSDCQRAVARLHALGLHPAAAVREAHGRAAAAGCRREPPLAPAELAAAAAAGQRGVPRLMVAPADVGLASDAADGSGLEAVGVGASMVEGGEVGDPWRGVRQAGARAGLCGPEAEAARLAAAVEALRRLQSAEPGLFARAVRCVAAEAAQAARAAAEAAEAAQAAAMEMS
ncbi:hypothetical protein HYH03_000763 [Edaphochlamys debaryana]|uniref:AP2/ERF domain-containing protein n=1 Tax=Edaphochlamys debaryana TaxID=47281 RepID=A0A836C6A7_9CHLO|nr:hypothetical protein HYH03_000763 [Edaphochlamys debaryana]|eukprot:KAG2500938.1 hypothetical protein HYH03_000763 [Edaphochlamys debaryana]